MMPKQISRIANIVIVPAVILLIIIFNLCGFKLSSLIGKYLGLIFFKFHPSNKTAYRNLKKVFPEKSKIERREIIRKMWINLGRNFAEFSLINRALTKNFISKHIDQAQLTELQNFIKAHPKIILVSAHYGAWEIAPKLTSFMRIPLYLVYRPINSQIIENIVAYFRTGYANGVITKGLAGAFKLVNLIKCNPQLILCMLMDQKMNNGIEAKFFGLPAKTSSSAADISRKYNMPIVMANIERIGDSTEYKVNLGPFLTDIPQTVSESKQVTQKINNIFEEWIRKDPKQWFWVHNRWPKEIFINNNNPKK